MTNASHKINLSCAEIVFIGLTVTMATILAQKNWVMVAINCENDTYVTMGDKYASAYSNFLWQEKMVHASYNFCF